jgi:hypothetical protein
LIPDAVGGDGGVAVGVPDDEHRPLYAVGHTVIVLLSVRQVLQVLNVIGATKKVLNAKK